MTRGVTRAERSPLSEEITVELARIHPSACDASLAQLASRLSGTKWVVRQRMRRLIEEAAR